MRWCCSCVPVASAVFSTSQACDGVRMVFGCFVSGWCVSGWYVISQGGMRRRAVTVRREERYVEGDGCGPVGCTRMPSRAPAVTVAGLARRAQAGRAGTRARQRGLRLTYGCLLSLNCTSASLGSWQERELRGLEGAAWVGGSCVGWRRDNGSTREGQSTQLGPQFGSAGVRAICQGHLHISDR